MCIADVIGLLEDRKARFQSLGRDELREIADTVFEGDRHDWMTAMLSQSASKARSDAGVRFHRSAPLKIIRKGVASFTLLTFIGICFLLINRGVGLAFLFAGPLTLLTFAYGYGLRTNDYLVGPRYSILGIVILSGLVITSLIAGIEAFF